MKDLSTVNYPTDTVYFPCVSHLLGTTAPYLCPEPHNFLYHRRHLERPSWRVPPLETMARSLWLLKLGPAASVCQGRGCGFPEAAQRCQMIQVRSTNVSHGRILRETDFTTWSRKWKGTGRSIPVCSLHPACLCRGSCVPV